LLKIPKKGREAKWRNAFYAKMENECHGELKGQLIIVPR
jgi:hypothetical protein